MGLEFAEADDIPMQQILPKCDKCKNILRTNNQFSCDDNKTLCGDCRKKYLEYIRKFFDS